MDTENAGREFPGEYRLCVEDFGPIAKASVDLRPLTVFIGPSNTGKSYLAILVYALHQCFGDRRVHPYAVHPRLRRKFMGDSHSPSQEADDDIIEMLESFRTWLQNQSNSRNQPDLPIDIGSDVERELTLTQHFSLRPLPQDVDAHFRSAFERAGGLGDYVKGEIERCFGVDDVALLIRHGSSLSSSSIRISVPRPIDAGIVESWIAVEEDGVGLSGYVTGYKSLSSEMFKLVNSSNVSLYIRQMFSADGIDSEDVSYALSQVSEELFSLLLSPLYRSVYYLPADRTGVMHSHQVVVSTLVQNAATAGLRTSASIPILSGVLADFLSQLIEMSSDQRRLSSRLQDRIPPTSTRLARSLEEILLRGAIHKEASEGGYPSFNYHPDGWRESLPLMRASSMVSELAPVVLYLRHLVEPEDVLIIEEPESHLHPAMQVEFTRQLAGLVRAGIRVIVTTHSEWVLQELANVVRASTLPEGEREGIAGGDVALDASQVGAWFFKPDPNGEGSTVSEIGLDEESGLYPTDFEEVARAMHNDWAEIVSRLGEAE